MVLLQRILYFSRSRGGSTFSGGGGGGGRGASKFSRGVQMLIYIEAQGVADPISPSGSSLYYVNGYIFRRCK